MACHKTWQYLFYVKERLLNPNILLNLLCNAHVAFYLLRRIPSNCENRCGAPEGESAQSIKTKISIAKKNQRYIRIQQSILNLKQLLLHFESIRLSQAILSCKSNFKVFFTIYQHFVYTL
jgi:hypothetical protein